MYGQKLPPQVLKILAQKAAEASGLLKLVGPLCKRAALTEAEADLLEQAVRNAQNVLWQGMEPVYQAHQVQYEASQAKRNGVAKA